ncbi:MAG: nucleotide-binding protein [Mesorhizobium sp.]|nr:nucleotide-binding protein [Mesorhizobium sp.]
MSKPKIFIASSSENLDVARTLGEALDYDAEVLSWEQGVFEPSEYPLESLERRLDATDFGVFIFSPDDVSIIRGEASPAVRDNVLFELGLFIGRLGRTRTFLVKPKSREMRLPSDLLGITPIEYDPEREDRNILAALGPAANSIRRAINRQGSRNRPGDAEATQNVSTGDSAVALSPQYLLSPEPHWSLERYERAYLYAGFSQQPAEQATIDAAFRGSPLAHGNENIAVWAAYCGYANMLNGQHFDFDGVRESIALYPQNARLRILLGRALAHYGDKAGALDAFKSAFQTATSMSTASEAAIAITSEVAEGPTEAVAEMRARLVNLPGAAASDSIDLVRSLVRLAQAEGMEQISGALTEVQLSHAPADIWTRFTAGYAYSEAQSDELAMLHYEAIPAAERSGLTWNNLGVAYRRLQLPGLAISAYRVASGKDEPLADANITHILVQAGLFDEASKQIDKAIHSRGSDDHIVGAISALTEAKKAEEATVSSAREKARTMQAVLLQLGRSALDGELVDISGRWQGPDWTIEIAQSGPYDFVGQGSQQYEASGPAGLFALNKRIVTRELECTLRRFGNAFEGSIAQKAQREQPVTLLASFDRVKRIAIFPDTSGHQLKVISCESGRWNLETWQRAPKIPAPAD